MNSIVVKNLTKSYKTRRELVVALNNVSFSVKKGEMFGLLGPNGAGKTTVLNILSALLSKDSGKVIVLGKELDENLEYIKQRMNIAPSFSYLTGILTIKENLKIYGKIYNVKNLNEKIDYLLKLFEIYDIKDKKVFTLSTGQTVRAIIAKGLINDPEILLLDECTSGLDPDIADKTRNILKEYYKKNKTTVIFTSHNMAEVEELCDRIAFLDKGKILKIGTPKELRRLIKTKSIKIDFFKNKKSLRKFFNKFNVNIKSISKNNNRIIFEIEYGKEHMANIIQALTRNKFKIKDINTKKPSLEDVFIKIARKEL